METKVQFETAKLAKEKNYDWGATHYFVLAVSSFKENRDLQKHNTDLGEKQYQHVVPGKGQPHIASAPTQSLLQKWLREKRNIIINVEGDNVKQYYSSVRRLKEKIVEDVKNKTDFCFLNYEEALEIGLQQALKLIP